MSMNYWNTAIDYREMVKLGTLLTINNIPHKTFYVNYGMQIVIYNEADNILDDAILAPHSHGCEKGLLETYHLNDCYGYETAQEVFDGWNEKYWGLTEFRGLIEC